jgi:hypothetical protein
MTDPCWVDAAAFLIPVGTTALSFCGFACCAFPSARDGVRALRSAPCPALLAGGAMAYLASVLLTLAALTLVLHAGGTPPSPPPPANSSGETATADARTAVQTDRGSNGPALRTAGR